MEQTTADAATTLTSRELAKRWGLAPHTLENWRSMGRGPAYIQNGRFVRYALDEVVAFESRFERYAPKAAS